ncbi:MAG: ParB/RepB/Spo0J family partition protein [Alphaproteobacteria bacterium]
MNSIHHGWSLDEIAPEARRAAERAAEAAGMPLEIWLNQLIKYVSAMELSGKGPARARAIDETIKRAAAEQACIGPVDGPVHESSDTPMMLETEAPAEQPTTVAAEMLEPNRFAEEHPGERDVEQAIGEWRKSGALKPLVVRPDSRQAGHYEIVSGMERWHAASRLHMRRIPVTVQQLSDEEVLRATLIQKLHTKSLPPLDEAEIYQRLMEETGLSVAALSDVIGRSPTHVATALQLLDLPEPVREMINSGELSVLHARTLLGAADPEPAAREVVARRLDIYQTEQLVRASHGALTPPAAKTETPAETKVAETNAAEPEAALPEAAEPEAAPEMPAPPPAADTSGEGDSEPTDFAPAATHMESAERDSAAMTLGGAVPSAPEPAGLASNGPTPDTAPATDQAAPPEASPSVAAAPDELTTNELATNELATNEPATNDPAASEPAASAPAADDTGISEAPLDMAEFITTDTGARESAPEAADKTSPIILGGIEGDAGTLIEASPAIDSPAKSSSLNESQAFDSSDDDNAEPPAYAEPPPEPLAAPDEENEPEPMNAAPVAAAMAPSPEPAPEPTPEPTSASTPEPPIEPPIEPLEIPAAAATSEDRPAGDAGSEAGSADRDAPMEESASSLSGAVAAPSNSGGSAEKGNPLYQDEEDDRDETRNDDSTRMVETHLTTLLGLKVSIAERNQDDGVLSIHYNSESELTDLVSRLNRMPTGRRAE